MSMSMSMSIAIFSVTQIVKLLQCHESVHGENKNVTSRK